jgi:hypothetical protein
MTEGQGQVVFFVAFTLFWLVAAHWMLEWRDEHGGEWSD